MQDQPERDELDLAVGVRRRCKKNSSVLSCIKRTREGCDRGSKLRTVYSGQDGRNCTNVSPPHRSG